MKNIFEEIVPEGIDYGDTSLIEEEKEIEPRLIKKWMEKKWEGEREQIEGEQMKNK